MGAVNFYSRKVAGFSHRGCAAGAAGCGSHRAVALASAAGRGGAPPRGTARACREPRAARRADCRAHRHGRAAADFRSRLRDREESAAARSSGAAGAACRMASTRGSTRPAVATSPFPDVVPIPPVFFSGPDWEFDLIDDLPRYPEQRNLTATKLGYRSALRVPIRLEGRLVAALAFLSFAPAAFKQTRHPDRAPRRRSRSR